MIIPLLEDVLAIHQRFIALGHYSLNLSWLTKILAKVSRESWTIRALSFVSWVPSMVIATSCRMFRFDAS
jgi:hypothetical protein